MYCVTFNNINLSEGEAYTLRQSLDVSLELSFWQRRELVKQGSDVVSIDCHKNLSTLENSNFMSC